ncbi:glycosyltransferase family 2 protein [Dechloromonas sp. ZS-1]|uniref:glycosyltransferase family 2 protein n=1 Tax=Dechloromonas sp. ZS-1 TaxID=3138067 RepID=UPI0031FE00BF
MNSRVRLTGNTPRFSIVTVCFNAISLLPDTVNSLRNQTYTDYEWIVIDGASTDGTGKWLSLQEPNIYLSEPDQGIYDAMNKAVARASGEWVFFLNAGDLFADQYVLAEVSKAIDLAISNAENPAVVYGDVVYYGNSGYRRRRFHWLTRRRLLFSDLCHQATFVRNSLFQRYGSFDLSLRFNADFDWFIRVFKAKEPLKYLARDIALFNDAGAHVANRKFCENERDSVRARYCPRPLWVLGHLALRLELKIRRILGETT